MESCGIKVIDMSIEDVEITNQMLAKAMARGAVAATDLEKTRLEQVAAITAAEGKSKAMNILATAEANRIKTLDEAKNATKDILGFLYYNSYLKYIQKLEQLKSNHHHQLIQELYPLKVHPRNLMPPYKIYLFQQI